MPNPMDMSASNNPGGAVGLGEDIMQGLEDYAKGESSSPINNVKNPWGQGLIAGADDDAIKNLAKELGVTLNDDTKDYLYQYYMQRKNDEWAYQKSLEADSTRYQRAVEDMKKAGLNPFLALQSLGGSNASANAGSVSSGSIASRKNAKLQSGTSVATQIMQVLGIIAAAVIYAMI